MKIQAVWMGLLGLTFLVPQAVWARAVALDDLVSAAGRMQAQGRQAVVVMDLDETTVDSTPRRWAAYRRTAEILCHTGVLAQATCETALSLNLSEIYRLPNTYDADALAVRIGLDPHGHDWQLLSGQMINEYLSGHYEQWDQPVAGSNAYVRELRARGVRVYFVTSRFDDVQRASTLASLRSMCMVTDAGEEADVILRPRPMASIDFKRWAYGRVLSESQVAHAKVIGAFENEPENIKAMKDMFPGAQLVFVNGAWIKGGEIPVEAERIEDFR